MNPPAPTPPPRPELCVFRDFTVRLLRRYLYMSVQLGRVPDILGREFFRSRISVRRGVTFENAVVFVHDISRCLEQLHPFDQQVIARCIMQEYTHDEAARSLHCTRQTIQNHLPDALDTLTAMLLERRLMVVARPRRASLPPETPNPETPASAAAPEPSPAQPPAEISAPPPADTPEPAAEVPIGGIAPELLACGNLFVKPPAEAICF